MPANVQIRNKDGTCYFLVCRDHIKYLWVMTVACVAGAWKKWVQERTGARETGVSVCLSHLRLGFPVSRKQGAQYKNYKVFTHTTFHTNR